ncbi:MAG: hypothetical protein SNJ77_05440 [Cytophagales bacterium]
MKKLVFLILTSLSICINAQETVTKATIISIWGDKQVIGGGLGYQLVLEKLAKDSSFSLIESLNKFEKKLNKNLFSEFPFPFTPKQEVVGIQDYVQLARNNPNSLINLYLVAANEYHIISSTDNDKIKKAFEIYKDVEAVAICFLNFEIFDDIGAMGISSQKNQSLREHAVV